MTFARFAVFIVLALAIELAVFRHVYRDLIYFQLSASEIASGPRGRLREQGLKALSRRTLSRTHLETLAVAAGQAGDRELQASALARLARDYPDDPEVQLRWADSLRLAGRLDEAEAIYDDLLGDAQGAPPR